MSRMSSIIRGSITTALVVAIGALIGVGYATAYPEPAEAASAGCYWRLYDESPTFDGIAETVMITTTRKVESVAGTIRLNDTGRTIKFTDPMFIREFRSHHHGDIVVKIDGRRCPLVKSDNITE